MEGIKLTRTETDYIRDTFERLESLVGHSVDCGASEALPKLLEDARKRAKLSAPREWRPTHYARAVVCGAVREGIRAHLAGETIGIGTLCTRARWSFLGYSLGCALARFEGQMRDGHGSLTTEEREKFYSRCAHLMHRLWHALSTYEDAADRYRAKLMDRVGGAR